MAWKLPLAFNPRHLYIKQTSIVSSTKVCPTTTLNLADLALNNKAHLTCIILSSTYITTPSNRYLCPLYNLSRAVFPSPAECTLAQPTTRNTWLRRRQWRCHPTRTAKEAHPPQHKLRLRQASRLSGPARCSPFRLNIHSMSTHFSPTATVPFPICWQHHTPLPTCRLTSGSSRSESPATSRHQAMQIPRRERRGNASGSEYVLVEFVRTLASD